jgi:hypothetical protein
MKTMMRIGALVMALCLMLCLCACGNDAQDNTDNTTTAPTTTAPTKPAEPTTEPTTKPAEPDYKVTVLDEGGNPVVGAWVQLCVEDGTCTPASTNDQGVAGFNLDTYNYKVSFMVLPEGYAYTSEQDTWYFEDGKTEMTIVLKAVG